MQQGIKQYTITCLNCKGSSRINIVNDMNVMYIDHTPIIACRLRGDLNWGFECVCGNDSRLAREEKDDAPMLMQQGSKEALDKLLASLKIEDEHKFVMEAA
jgi:hypothetical protein